MQKNLIIAIMVTSVIAGGSGYVYGKKSASGITNFTQNQGTNGSLRGSFAGGAGRGARGGGTVGGQIIAADENSITVQLSGNQSDGSTGSKIVFLTNTTQVMKSTQGTASDLVVGTQVMTIGAPNADGSINAQSIQIRPQGFGRGSSTPPSN